MTSKQVLGAVGVFTILIAAGVILRSGESKQQDNEPVRTVSTTKEQTIPENNKQVVQKGEQKPPVTVKANDEAEETIRVCTDSESMGDDELFEETFKKDEKILSEWKRSENPVDKLALLLVSYNKTPEYLANLNKFVNSHPDNKMAAWQLLMACTSQPQDGFCSEQNIQNNAAAINSTGNYWEMLAIVQIQRGNEAGALESLRRANASPQLFRVYSESINLFQQALTNIGSLSYREQAFRAIEFSAALSLPSYQSLEKFCASDPENYAEVTNACLRWGERVSTDSDSLFLRTLGLSFQSNVYQATGESERAAEIKRQIKKIMEKSSSEQNMRAKMLALRDDDLARYWLESMIAFGEEKSNRALEEEAIRLSADKDYDPCH